MTSTGISSLGHRSGCHAGASANILNGRKATSFFTVKDDMIHAGALWLDELVVVDGNLITSRKPDDLPDFMKAVISSLKQTLGASR